MRNQSILVGAGNSDTLQEEQREAPVRYTLLDEKTASAIKELIQLKDTLQAMQEQSICSNLSVTSNEVTEGQTFAITEMITLVGSDVVPKKMYEKVNKSRVSLFVQDLATLIFGKEVLRTSTLMGKSGKKMLDPHKVNGLIDTAMARFPGTSVSEIRSLLRRKCNNESFSKKLE